MLRCCLLALVAALSIPSAGRADDNIAALYPDAATFALGVDVKGITNSPVGRMVIGNDKPFDATRKLMKVLFPTEVLQTTDTTLKPLESVVNKLARVTVVGNLGRNDSLVIFLEGDIDEDAYFQAADAIAKAEKKEFYTDQFGDRKLFVFGPAGSAAYGLKLSKSLFVVASPREVLDEVLEKSIGKKAAKVQKPLAEMLGRVKPAETPVWLAVGKLDPLKELNSGLATIALADDAVFHLEANCADDKAANLAENAAGFVVKYLKNDAQTPQGKVWGKAGLAVKRDGTTVTVTGRIATKVLVEEYAKVK